MRQRPIGFAGIPQIGVKDLDGPKRGSPPFLRILVAQAESCGTGKQPVLFLSPLAFSRIET
jgi:hypothetical protein